MRKTSLFCSIMLPIFAFTVICQGEGVHFECNNLKSAVERQLGITDPSESDMLKLVKLQARSSNIESIEGLQFAVNLEHLDLWNNQISDAGPLSNLVKLKELWLSGNKISDISALSGLQNMDRLFLFNNQISDMQAVKGMTKLSGLSLYGNRISDVSPVAGLEGLEFLWLGSNKISDISALASLKELPKLSLYKNEISDISALAPLTKLTYLELQSNKIADISSLASMTEMTLLWISDNEIRDISVLAGMTKLDMLRFDDNHVTDITALKDMDKLKTLHFHQNKVSDIGALESMKELTSLFMQDNLAEDVKVLSELKSLKSVKLQDNPVKTFYDGFPILNNTAVHCDGAQLAEYCSKHDGDTGVIEVPEKISELTLTQSKTYVYIKPEEGPVRMPVGKYRVNSWTMDAKEADGQKWQLKVSPTQKYIDVDRKKVTLEYSDKLIATLAITKNTTGHSFKQTLKNDKGENVYIYLNGERAAPPKLRVSNDDKTYNNSYDFKYG